MLLFYFKPQTIFDGELGGRADSNDEGHSLQARLELIKD